MSKSYSLQELRDRGFILEGARRFYDPDRDYSKAMDADPVTAPNTGVPVELTTYFNPKVVHILTRPHRARKIISEVTMGNATTSSAKFPVAEIVGSTAPYNDFSNAGHTDTNYNWPDRDNYLFETIRHVGDLEADVSAQAKINLAADTQRAAAFILDVDANRFAFRGVAGRRIYGLLNDPALNPAIPPLPAVAAGGGTVTAWADKSTRQIFDDIRALYAELINQLGGNDDVDASGVDTKIVLAMSADTFATLSAATDFNVSVLTMIKAFFKNLEIVTAPEYSTAAGQLVQMIIPELEGQKTAEIGTSEKFHGFPPVRSYSSFGQKFRAGTFGTVVYRPAAIGAMLGV